MLGEDWCLQEHSPSLSSASFEHSASFQCRIVLAVGRACRISKGANPEHVEQFAVPEASAEIAELAVVGVWQYAAEEPMSALAVVEVHSALLREVGIE